MARRRFTVPAEPGSPARVIALGCAVALGAGLFVQHVLGYEPCSLCIFQRLAFAAALAFALPLALRRFGPTVTALLAVLSLVAILLGLGVASYQVWLNAFTAGVTRCGRGIAAYFDDTSFEMAARWLLEAAGDCGKPPRFGPITMPQLGLLTFVALSALALRLASAATLPALIRAPRGSDEP